MKNYLVVGKGLEFLLSFFIVAWGTPAGFAWLSPVAAAIGYALFWNTSLSFPRRRERFFQAVVWYALVQAVQLSWMTSLEFQGVYILFVYAALSLWLGIQFGCLSFFFPLFEEARAQIKIPRLFAIASVWTLFEWGRLHVLCGFSFNPAGMALASYLPSMQMASLLGILGLSFWVMFVNLLALRVLSAPPYFSFEKLRKGALWAGLALLPYCFGWAHLAYHDRKSASQASPKKYSTALVQTALLPSEKIPLEGRLYEFVPPLEQWRRILNYLKEQRKGDWDLIVLPEVAVPFRFDDPVYPLEKVLQILRLELGEKKEYLPLKEGSLIQSCNHLGKGQRMVSNAFLAQAVANYYCSEVVIGLEAQEGQKNYNAAFHFVPMEEKWARYEKRVLLPLAEYLPFDLLKPLVKRYGICDFFTQGKEAKIFLGKVPLSISICYEEMFSEIVRQGRVKGAALLVNLTNDNWYPKSSLPEIHFDHARLRTVENGVPLVRACNGGVTAIIDSLGRVVSRMGQKGDPLEADAGALVASFSLYQYKTLYTFLGDMGIVLSALILIGIFCCFKKHLEW